MAVAAAGSDDGEVDSDGIPLSPPAWSEEGAVETRGPASFDLFEELPPERPAVRKKCVWGVVWFVMVWFVERRL